MSLIKKYSNTFKECRGLQHSWVHGEVLDHPLKPDLRGVVSECSICHTARTKWINARTGENRYAKYDYPDGYSLAGVSEKPAPAEWRVELLSVLGFGVSGRRTPKPKMGAKS